MTNIVKYFRVCRIVLSASLLFAGGLVQAQVMDLPGAFDVTNSGAATYTIPVAAPPGTAGMEPALAVQYSSQGGNGMIGLGVELAGLYSIQRCPRTDAQDGAGNKGSVNYDANDRFCLNGDRLVAVSGTYGANNTEYRTELESFSRIVSYGTAGSGPQWFKVWTKAGQILELGNTTDSRLLRSSGTTVRGWHVNRIGDTTGNYLTVTWNKNDAQGMIYPSRIDYTGTTTASPYNSVRFEYSTTRLDVVPHYHLGDLSQMSALLTKIKTFEGNNPVSEYQLSYLAGSALRPTRLQSVALCNANGASCLPATTFNWPTFSDTVSFTGVAWPLSGPKPGIFTGDFNGDGLPDFLMGMTPYSNYANAQYWMSTAPGQWQSQSRTVGYSMAQYLTSPVLTPYPLDLNADGFTDGIIDESGIYDDGFNPPVPYGPLRKSNNVNDKSGNLPLPPSSSFPVWADAKPFGDLNGDGRDDQLMLQPSPTGATPYYSNGDGTFTAGSTISGLYSNAVVLAGDFDGNGCMDILAQGAVNGIYFNCNAATTFLATTNWVSGNNKLVPADYNGDGKTDLLVTHATNTGTLMLATGSGTGFVSSGFTVPAGWARFQIGPGDFNGDGRMDVGLIAATTIGGGYGPTTAHEVHLSTGSGFVSAGSYANPTGDNTAHIHDLNGDGVADVWLIKPTSNSQFVTNYQPQLVSSITTGLGLITTLTYERLNSYSTTYTKGSTATYPEMEMVGGQYVVSLVQSPNAVGSQNSYQYRYAGARLHHQGRGLLGFKERIVTDLQTNIVHTTVFRQDYPFVGQVASESEVLSGVVLRSTTNTYAADTLTPATGGQRRFVKLTQSVEARKDLNGANFPTLTTSYSYDTWGNATQITVAGSGGDTKTTTNVYTNTVTSTTWLLGRLTSTSTVHALSGQPSITRAASFQYNGTTGLLTQEVIEPGTPALRLTTDYTRSTAGNITAIQQSGTDITTRTTNQGYDSLGRFQTSLTNAKGQVASSVYSAAFGVPTQQTDVNNLTRSFLYDSFGRLTRVTEPDTTYQDVSYAYCSGVAGGSASCPTHGAFRVELVPRLAGIQNGPRVYNYYDRLGRPLAEDVEGVGAAMIRSAREYDALGREQKTSRPWYLSGGTAQWTTRNFDALGRVTSEIYPDSNSSTFSYNGLTSSVTNAKSQTTTTVLNSQLQIFQVTEPGSTTTEYLYTAAGDLRQIKDPGNNLTTLTVDTRGRVTQRQDPNLGTWTYQHNVLDQVKQQTDAKSQATTFTYDVLQRPTLVAGTGFSNSFTYDTATKGVGKLAQMETTTGQRRTHTYDSLGRPATTVLRVDGTNRTYTYGYNSDGRLYTVQYPSGFTARYEYTSTQGYLEYLRVHGPGTMLWQANARNAEGQYTQATLGNGVQVQRNFNAQTGRISSITAGVANTVANFSYGYDQIGNLTSRSDANQSLTETFQHDSLNRLTQSTIGANTRSFAYNAMGNITSKTQLGGSGTNSYTYAGSKPHAVSSISGLVNGISNPSFSYDNNGNLTSGAGRSMTWTGFNKVATLTQGVTSISYEYDAQQQRLKQTVAGSTIVYLNDPVTGIGSELHPGSGSTWHDYLQADGERIGLRISTTSPVTTSWQVYIQDYQGSVAVVTDITGAVTQRLGYDAWGRRRQPNGTEDPSGSITAPTSRGYTDHEHIPNVSLINMNGRVFDPEVGRFLSADPVIPNLYGTQAQNRYSYVYNNPGRYTDPNGHCVELASCVKTAQQIYVAYQWFKSIFRDRERNGPPPQHQPGLASVNVSLRGPVPLYDVSSAPLSVQPRAGVAQATAAGGSPSYGGAKFMNGADSAAFDYAADGGLSWLDKVHLVLNGASIAMDASIVLAPISWIPDIVDAGISVAEGDLTGAVMSVGAVPPGVGILANGAKAARIADKSLGANPFRGKSAKEIAEMLERKGYIPKGPDPAAGRGTYVNPRTGRGYHIDASHPAPKGPHVGVHRTRAMRDSLAPRDYPIGDK